MHLSEHHHFGIFFAESSDQLPGALVGVSRGVVLPAADDVEKVGIKPEAVDVLPLTQYPIFNTNPASVVNGSAAVVAPYYLDWLAHPSYGDFWKRISIEEHFADIQVPALHTGAWYDIFLGGSLRNYMGIKANGGSEEARKGQRLLVVIGVSGMASLGGNGGELEDASL